MNLTIILSFGFIVVGLMGAFGFHSFYAAVPEHQGASWLDCIYATLRLYFFNFDGNLTAHKPVMLELARWLAPVLLATSVIRATLRLFRRQTDALRARFLSGHTIVCGVGHKGGGLVGDLLDSRKDERVVIIERNEEAEKLNDSHKSGALCIIGDATTKSVLQAAGVTRARCIIALTGDDNDNLEIGLAASETWDERSQAGAARCLWRWLGQVLAVGTPPDTLQIFVHIGDPQLRDLLQRSGTLNSPNNSITIRPFNYFVNTARVLLENNPLEVLNVENTLAAAVHVVVPEITVGGQIQALIVQIARIGHYSNGRPVEVHILSPQAEQEVASLREAYPFIDRCCNLTTAPTKSAASYGPNAAQAAQFVVSKIPAAAVTVFASFNDEQDALAQALAVAEKVKHLPGVRIVLPVDSASPVAAIVKHNADLKRCVRLVPPVQKVCGTEAVLWHKLDKIAQVIHANWYRDEATKPEDKRKKATFKPWDELTEAQKDSNRSQADHILVKIRAAGLTVEEAADEKQWKQAVALIIEDLARAEHVRWCAEKWMDGWEYDATRNDELKRHNNLVPYEELDEATKKYDRESVYALPQYAKLLCQKN